MEEKEILNEVNSSGNDKVRRILMYIGWGLSAILLVCGIMLISRVMKLNVLTTPYMVILIASVIVVTGVIAFLQKWMVPGIITKIIAIAMSVIMVIGSRYLGATSKALDKMSGMKTQIDNVCTSLRTAHMRALTTLRMQPSESHRPLTAPIRTKLLT